MSPSRFRFYLRMHLLLVVCVLLSSGIYAQSRNSEDSKKKFVDGNFAAEASTNVNFQDTMIDGKMQAPSGFFLQGRNQQSLSQMVKLRPDFKRELKSSTSLAKAIVK